MFVNWDEWFVDAIIYSSRSIACLLPPFFSQFSKQPQQRASLFFSVFTLILPSSAKQQSGPTLHVHSLAGGCIVIQFHCKLGKLGLCVARIHCPDVFLQGLCLLLDGD